MGTALVDYRTDSGVALISLSDPPRNELTHEMMKDLDEAILDARFDNDVHVVVVTGHGDSYFSAGNNVQMLSEVDASFRYYFSLHAAETLGRIENTPKLVIAAINGHALGAGLEIALACDIRIAREGSFTVGFPDIRLGLMPSAGGISRLRSTVGRSAAFELLCEGPKLDPIRAKDLGLVHHLLPAASGDEFLAKVLEHARRFLPPNTAARAIGSIKRSIIVGEGMNAEQTGPLDRALWESEDAVEGLRAYLEQRSPRFTGR